MAKSAFRGGTPSGRPFSGKRMVEGQNAPPYPQPAIPVQPPPPAGDVPAPAATSFNVPAPKKMATMKQAQDLKTVSEAIAAAKFQSGDSVPATPRPQTFTEHDLKGVSESINDMAKKNDQTGAE